MPQAVVVTSSTSFPCIPESVNVETTLLVQLGHSYACNESMASLLQVSGNHRLDDSKAEQERIRDQGFEISSSNVEGRPCGPLRVWPGGLAMGRSIGDYDVRTSDSIQKQFCV